MNAGSSISSMVTIPALTFFLLLIDSEIKFVIDSPFLKGVSKSVSELEKRQFLIFPFAVRRILLQPSQNGLVIELMIPKSP